ncbi:uroporphyrinogen III synthase, uroporhyrinogen decarboxylase [Rhodopirellula baltica SH28]|uniref:Uroporphyrinogen decarboxylase n=1 Tax=Rhodopirellula baltica SH28 TaxID=993517 RepID=K5DC39_RHOBT|nr:uroporphyrinogen decarboxylase [Rhodopirellula baltica]EKK00028.1 uroporphyrinogen III synthase, uroporhyrinogen decarboxylase [Rhodopirellula baltica SH28]
MAATTNNFDGLRVAALESRRADDMTRLICKFGGEAFVSPSMREVPIEPNRAAIDFAYRIITGDIGIVIVMTGVGFRYLLKATEKHVDQQRLIDALSDITTICRGPKPVAVMREFGLKPTHRVPEPNTWRELLQTIDAGIPIANQTIGIQEYGVSNKQLIAGLEARGAIAESVKVYGWEFPEDTQPLKANTLALAEGERDILLVTSAHQVVNLLRMAEDLGVSDSLRDGLSKTAIVSIGPTTSDMLREHDLAIAMEPSHPKMGHLVSESARDAKRLVDEVRERSSGSQSSTSQTSVSLRADDSSLISASKTPMPAIDDHPSQSSLFMRACRGEPTPRTPVWMMRQAGRYMQEYREVRSQQTFLELCANPKLCSEVMCTAVEKLNVDAAIIFSDLLPILVPMGFDLEFVKGDGPVIHNPVRSAADVDRVKGLDSPQDLGFVYETVKQTRADLPEGIPLIGFAGAPFTLASYAIEGGGSRQYSSTKALMRAGDGGWAALMDRLTDAIIVYLNEQISAGAQCVQLFDSWAGCLSPGDYSEFVLPWMKRILEGVTPGVPLINFATGNPELLPLLRGDRRTVVGVDWRIELDVAWKRVGHDISVQGNLDPSVLLTDAKTIRAAVQDVLNKAGGRPGHIFNLGHGVLQQTPVENAIELVKAVKELSVRDDFSAEDGGTDS